VCVKNFLGLPSNKIFDAIRRVAKDRGKALNAETIAHAHQHGWINDWERNFSIDTMQKRVLSDKQQAIRQEINRKILANTSR